MHYEEQQRKLMKNLVGATTGENDDAFYEDIMQAARAHETFDT